MWLVECSRGDAMNVLVGWLIIIGIGSSSSCRQVLSNDIDLLHPPVELERRKHKLKRLVQSPNSFFMVSFKYISLVLACVSVFQELCVFLLQLVFLLLCNLNQKAHLKKTKNHICFCFSLL